MKKFPITIPQNPFSTRLSKKQRSRFLPLAALALPALLVPDSSLQAAAWTWNVTSGNYTTASNWNPATAPSNTATDDIFLTNGTLVSSATTTLTATRTAGTLAVGTYNTFAFSAGYTVTSLTNNGLIIGTANISRAAGVSITNSGTMQSGAGVFGLSTATVTNTGGTILATNSGSVRFINNATVTDGTLRSVAGGGILQNGLGNSNQNLALNNVTIDNQGSFTNIQDNVSGNVGSTLLQVNLGASTVFTNAAGATTQVLNAGSVATTSANARRSVFNVNAGATFNNAGSLIIQNDATRTGSLTGQDATFTVASTGAFTNTGTVRVIANTTAVGATAAFSATTSLTNEGLVHVKGNANNAFASFSVTGTYTQSGVGNRRTIIEQGGTISAGSLLISSGTLGGVGVVSGTTTIGADGALVAGVTAAGVDGAGVLTLNNQTILGSDSELKFSLGANTATSGQIVLVGSAGLTLGTNVTLTLTDLTGGSWVDGTTYRIVDFGAGALTGSLSNFTLNIVPSGWTATLSTGAGGTDYVDVTLHAVPEPSAALLLALAGTSVLIFRRRAQRA
jgi:fibronectin-binding autotransporter adhesin